MDNIDIRDKWERDACDQCRDCTNLLHLAHLALGTEDLVLTPMSIYRRTAVETEMLLWLETHLPPEVVQPVFWTSHTHPSTYAIQAWSRAVSS